MLEKGETETKEQGRKEAAILFLTSHEHHASPSSMKATRHYSAVSVRVIGPSSFRMFRFLCRLCSYSLVPPAWDYLGNVYDRLECYSTSLERSSGYHVCAISCKIGKLNEWSSSHQAWSANGIIRLTCMHHAYLIGILVTTMSRQG